jgi:hypothetical protein
VARVVFAQQFLREVAAWEQGASPRDRDALERVLAAIAADPTLPGRVPSFYDPHHPSYLYRSGAFLVHYQVVADGTVEFLNLFT